jgi:metallo-beta-lactamase family protein
MKTIEFFGAASNEVTGSNYLLTGSEGQQVLIDFGMFQGSPELDRKNYEPLLFDPRLLEGVFLTHAHLDHCGRLPLLVYGGFSRKIYMTEPTKSFVEIILNDSARIGMMDQGKLGREPLYTQDEVEKVLKMIEVVEYDQEVSAGDFRAVFKDAGHILGSASIRITEGGKSMVFSGDLGNTPQDLVRPTEYFTASDYVVMESTYGASDHPQEDAAEIIREEINKVENAGGVLLIPAFAIERTQELLHIIHHLKKDGKVRPETPVFLDTPMGINATEVYLAFQDYYNEHIKSHGDEIPFNFEGLVITDEPRDSKAILESPPPKVIIAGSGMMSGGRIMHHATNYLAHETTRILFVGYQADETTGRQILEGAKNVVIDKKQIPVRAKIREIKNLSSHADQTQLVKWLRHMEGVRKVFITHGETAQRTALREMIKDQLKIQEVFLPDFEEKFTFE